MLCCSHQAERYCAIFDAFGFIEACLHADIFAVTVFTRFASEVDCRLVLPLCRRWLPYYDMKRVVATSLFATPRGIHE